MHHIVAQPAQGETAFRLFRVADGLDFRSDHARGRAPRGPQTRNALIHMGLSFWATEESALAKNQHFDGKLGDHVAELELRGDLGIWHAETFSIEHVTVWGRAGDLEQCVRDIRTV